MKRRVLPAAVFAVACVAGCGAAGQAGSGGNGTYSLINATYPACESQGQALAQYLATGDPAADNLNWGDYRQEELSLSGAKQSLYISQVADEYISQCDTADAQAAAQAAASASASASASAQASLQAAIQADAGAECTKIGGSLASDYRYCIGVPFYGTDGNTYGDDLSVSGTALATDTTGDSGDSATQSECEQGYYPEGSAGPVHGTPGYFAYGICLVNNPS